MPTLLELALLSMDVYEKSVDGSLNAGGVGNFGLGAVESGTDGFFAQAYTFSGGTVVAYRGTDNDLGDWTSNISTMFGNPVPTSQEQQAALFYKQVIGATDPGEEVTASSNVYLTGHSLGGKLAGFVGSLYGASASIFNNGGGFTASAEFARSKSQYIQHYNQDLTPSYVGPAIQDYSDTYFNGLPPPIDLNLASITSRALHGDGAQISPRSPQ